MWRWECLFWVGGGGGRSILWFSQSGDHPLEDLATFGNNLNMRLKNFKASFSIFLVTYLNHLEIWRSFSNFGRIMAIKKRFLKKN
jgi:hypothetical protein